VNFELKPDLPFAKAFVDDVPQADEETLPVDEQNLRMHPSDVYSAVPDVLLKAPLRRDIHRAFLEHFFSKMPS
jgi:hypothetical protein